SPPFHPPERDEVQMRSHALLPQGTPKNPSCTIRPRLASVPHTTLLVMQICIDKYNIITCKYTGLHSFLSSAELTNGRALAYSCSVTVSETISRGVQHAPRQKIGRPLKRKPNSCGR